MTSKLARFLQPRRVPLIAALTIGTLLSSTTVHAGPPLICHPYDIGAAKSLPGGGKGHWLGVDKTYDRKNLERDTLALLTPDTPILVRMETLRRASIYATSEMRGWGNDRYTDEDRAIALGLLAKLRERTGGKTPTARALALFDAGFYAETLRQTGMEPKFDGYAALVQAAELRSADPEVQFALALASVRPERKEHAEHLARARAAAKPGSLLATNLTTHFSKS